MNLWAHLVLGPSSPRRWRMRQARSVYSQSSMNSQRCERASSLALGISLTMARIVSTTLLLYTNWPSSRSDLERKFRRTVFLRGYLKQRPFTASATLHLKSSEISIMKLLSVLRCDSTLLSTPVFRSMLMASVATLRFESETSISRSCWQLVTGAFTLFRMRRAETRAVDLVLFESIEVSIVTAVATAEGGTMSSSEQRALAASNFTMVWPNLQFCKNWISGMLASTPESLMRTVMMRMKRQTSKGEELPLACWLALERASLVTARRSCLRIW
mmetsp:Transcript_7821/g.32909  ORF Transcript_7821/g.32909 Transcript_7821/m.32909 type:complete len:273 (+) Transcript_7821:1237-2055(+)